MFESAEAGHTVSQKAFRREEAVLRNELLLAQNALRNEAAFPVLIVIAGMEGSGRRETITCLHEWLDPRFLSTVAFVDADRDDPDHPPMWRYWQALPPRGRIGILADSWYAAPMAQRLAGELKRTQLDARLERIRRLETLLVNEGALLLKFWFHLGKAAQTARYRQLRDHPETAWRVSAASRARLGQYDAVRKVAAHVLRLSSTTDAPWIILDGSDDNYRKLAVGRALRDALAQRAAHPPPRIPHAAPLQTGRDRRNVLSALDLSLALSDRKYERELARLQGRLAGLMRHRRFARHSLVLAFEGMDAAGKGGAIRRVSAALDPRIFQIVPVAAPSDEERAQPWLWRFWRRVPGKGRVTIFDRSWYGRVLVERIEGFCSEADWLRAYAEICDFEHELVEAGAIVLKFWLQIDKTEQLRRFREREQTSWKQFKITQEDWRNRGKWAQYQEAAVDMIDRTGTGRAPWITIEANDKRHARIKILRSICEAVEHAMGID